MVPGETALGVTGLGGATVALWLLAGGRFDWEKRKAAIEPENRQKMMTRFMRISLQLSSCRNRGPDRLSRGEGGRGSRRRNIFALVTCTVKVKLRGTHNPQKTADPKLVLPNSRSG